MCAKSPVDVSNASEVDFVPADAVYPQQVFRVQLHVHARRSGCTRTEASALAGTKKKKAQEGGCVDGNVNENDEE